MIGLHASQPSRQHRLFTCHRLLAAISVQCRSSPGPTQSLRTCDEHAHDLHRWMDGSNKLAGKRAFAWLTRHHPRISSGLECHRVGSLAKCLTILPTWFESAVRFFPMEFEFIGSIPHFNMLSPWCQSRRLMTWSNSTQNYKKCMGAARWRMENARKVTAYQLIRTWTVAFPMEMRHSSQVDWERSTSSLYDIYSM